MRTVALQHSRTVLYWDINADSAKLLLVSSQYKELKLQTREILMKFQFFKDDALVPNEFVAQSMTRYEEICADELKFSSDCPSRKSQWLANYRNLES